MSERTLDRKGRNAGLLLLAAGLVVGTGLLLLALAAHTGTHLLDTADNGYSGAIQWAFLNKELLAFARLAFAGGVVALAAAAVACYASAPPGRGTWAAGGLASFGLACASLLITALMLGATRFDVEGWFVVVGESAQLTEQLSFSATQFAIFSLSVGVFCFAMTFTPQLKSAYTLVSSMAAITLLAANYYAALPPLWLQGLALALFGMWCAFTAVQLAGDTKPLDESANQTTVD